MRLIPTPARLLLRVLEAAATSLAIISSSLPHASAAYQYDIVDYPGSTSTTISSINNKGEFVGTFSTPSSANSYRRSATGVFSQLIAPDATGSTRGTQISNDGRIVGLYFSNPGGSSTQTWAFVRQANGEYQNYDLTPLIGTPAGTTRAGGTVVAINSSGLAVGSFYALFGPGAPGGLFLHSPIPSPDGTFTIFSFDGATEVSPIDMNDAGLIAGSFCSQTIGDSCVARAGFIAPPSAPREDFTVIQYPGARSTFLTGMNNRGDVIGVSDIGESSPLFFLRTAEGDYRELDLPPGTNPSGNLANGPQDINDAGVIVGYYREDSTIIGLPDVFHGYIATPAVPEPSTWFMIVLGFAACGLLNIRVSRRRCDRSIAASPRASASAWANTE